MPAPGLPAKRGSSGRQRQMAAGPKPAIQVAAATQKGELRSQCSRQKWLTASSCFATLFSFVGTVLGGIWADQSVLGTGFWGWDPRRKTARSSSRVVECAGVALALHRAGSIRERGLVSFAPFSEASSLKLVVVSGVRYARHRPALATISWMPAFCWLLAFVASQLALIALGCLPLRFWKSFQPPPVPASTESGSAPPGATATA